MHKFLATLLLVAVVANTGSAFTAPSAPSVARRQEARRAPLGPSFDVPAAAASSTALNLKVDPNSIKGNKNESGNAKMAAYGGSVAFAVALPVLFLIWSAVNN
ncbi:hypothetical protein ACHAXT_012210 [Thalassiosira profunda]